MIYTGKMYASNAMLAHTGSGQKLNLRVGLDTEKYRVELYCVNCTDDDQPKGLQQMYDLSGITGGLVTGQLLLAVLDSFLFRLQTKDK
ncbi:MAG: hypothetical protein Ct9H300mP4_11040 [Gammaproteobacteria bacterium]|nr:MAG: hypothetical protein Ct9H300mP4_11040 [Gammaproteobacteria bacterium]